MIRKSTSIVIFTALLFSLALFSCSDSTTTSVQQGDDDNVTTSPPADEFSHTLSPGQSAPAFLTSDTFTDLVVEIQFMPGAAPNNESIDNLRSFLEEHLDKSSVTVLEPTEIAAGGQESYTASDVRGIEEENRQVYTSDSELAAYILFIDGEYESNSVLGIAYYNTSTAYFGDTIDRISGGLGQPSSTEIESTVFAHEFGHLMGLVNNGTEAQADHHDSDNGAHCTVEDCLMYFQVETTNFFANLFDGSIPELDDFCLADIAALKE